MVSKSKWFALSLVLVLFSFSTITQAQDTSETRNPRVTGPDRVTPGVYLGDVRDLPVVPPRGFSSPVREIQRRITHPGNLMPPPPPVNPTTWKQDPLLALQEAATKTATSGGFGVPNLNFSGQGYTNCVPPDTVGDVGPVHYIQMVNSEFGSSFTIYRKSDGRKIAGPIILDSLSPGGECSDGAGDPIVLYDPLAGRWLMSEMHKDEGGGNDALCVYISATDDPVSGGWYSYCFVTPQFPDYPKYAVWPDAYYVSTNEPGEPGAYALDRTSMLAGVPALLPIREIVKPGQLLDGFIFQSLLPSDFDGTLPPPPDSPNYFIRHRDDEAHNPATNNPFMDFLEIWEFHVDFVTPELSTFIFTDSIPIAEIDSDLCGLIGFTCFPQPGTLVELCPIREMVMWRLQYRNFGTHESLVGNLVTDVDGNDHGGIRWFELRKTVGSWTLYQEGTFAPDSDHRWMASAAMDREGNMALGYSVSSETTYPGIRYTGRRVDDPLGTMTQGEVNVVVGPAASLTNRWGDYSSMNVDPIDDCTFWYTNEYVEHEDSKGWSWSTQIASFVFDSCLDGGTNGVPDEQEIGACCLNQNSVCRDFLNECECTNSNGVFTGNGTSCGFELACTGPIVEILTPSEGDTFPEFSDILITVDAYDVNTGGFVEQVEFFVELNEGMLEGVDTNGMDGWSFLLEEVSAGNFMLDVIATDNDGLTGIASLLLRVECPTPDGTEELSQTCTGTVDCPLAPLPFGPDSLTRIDPNEFDFGDTGNNCYPTMGRTLAATALSLNGINEAQLFTNLPATEILSGGSLHSIPLQGCALHAGGTICLPGIGEALSVTDRAMASVSGGILNEHLFPDDSLPLSAAGIVSCSGCSNTFTFAVETAANTIETISGGEILSFPIEEPINDLPISFTNGSISGILAFTNTNSHTILGGVDNVVPLNGQYIGNRIGPDGVTVFTTGDGTCYPTLGTILGATVAGSGVITESVLFTDAPSIEVISGGIKTAFELTGTRLFWGGSVCVFNMVESIAITDRAICTVAGGSLAESVFPEGVDPVSAGGIGVCSIGNSFTLCVEMETNGIRCVSDGVVTDFPIPDELAARPVSWTDGTMSGVVAFTSSEAYVISGGVMTLTTLPGDFILYTPTVAGASVLTTGGIIVIPVAPGSAFKDFGICDGATDSAISYNLGPCPAMAGVTAGWSPSGVKCAAGLASAEAGGPFNPTPSCGPGGCGGTIQLPLADFPFDQGTAHTVTNPDVLVYGGLLLAIGPDASILPFADCSEQLPTCAPTGNITLNMAPCADTDGDSAAWPTPALGVICVWGACCLPDGECIDRVTIDCCNSYGGLYLGDGSECLDPIACCLAGGECQMLDPRCCENLGGTPIPTACWGNRGCCVPGGDCVVADVVCCPIAPLNGFSVNVCLGDVNPPNNINDACEIPPLDFDCDYDDDVDLDDWQCMEDCLGGPGHSIGLECYDCDFDGDLDVDMFDAGKFQEAFTGDLTCPCNGDVNGDGFVNLSDRLYIENPTCFNMPASTCPSADVNCDGIIDQSDSDVVMCQMGQPAPGDPGCCEP